MLVSYRWLCELLPDANFDPQGVANALTGVGLAVDGIDNYEDSLRPVVLAEVLSIEPHPSRDTLNLVTIRTRAEGVPEVLGSIPPMTASSSPAQLTVVCGAKNVPAAGCLVVFAGLGAKLPGKHQ